MPAERVDVDGPGELGRQAGDLALPEGKGRVVHDAGGEGEGTDGQAEGSPSKIVMIVCRGTDLVEVCFSVLLNRLLSHFLTASLLPSHPHVGAGDDDEVVPVLPGLLVVEAQSVHCLMEDGSLLSEALWELEVDYLRRFHHSHAGVAAWLVKLNRSHRESQT